MKERIFLTHVLPYNLIAAKGLSFAACNFSFNLMSGGGFDKVYSTMPPYVSGKLSVNNEAYELIYSPLHKMGGILGKLAFIHDQWLVFRRIPNDASLWLYNLCQLNFILVILLRLFKRKVKVNVIELDFTPSPKFSVLGLCLYLMNHSNGMICLAQSQLFVNKNMACLPGVVPLDAGTSPNIIKPDYTFLLSGVLNEPIALLSKVIEAFASTPNFKLYITGSPTNEEVLKKMIEGHHNIIYMGQLPYIKYLKLLDSVTFQLSTRDPLHPDNKCNFPSKIIEALLHNRIVVSTIRYPQLDDARCLDIDADNIKDGLRKIAGLSESELIKYANQSDIVKKQFSPHIWFETMKIIESYEDIYIS